MLCLFFFASSLSVNSSINTNGSTSSASSSHYKPSSSCQEFHGRPHLHHGRRIECLHSGCGRPRFGGVRIKSLGVATNVGGLTTTLKDDVLHEHRIVRVVDRGHRHWHFVEQPEGAGHVDRRDDRGLLPLRPAGRLPSAVVPWRDVEVGDTCGRCRSDHTAVKQGGEPCLPMAVERQCILGVTDELGEWCYEG